MTTINLHSEEPSIASSGRRGGRRRMSRSAGSMTSAKAGRPSVTRFTQSDDGECIRRVFQEPRSERSAQEEPDERAPKLSRKHPPWRARFLADDLVAAVVREPLPCRAGRETDGQRSTTLWPDARHEGRNAL